MRRLTPWLAWIFGAACVGLLCVAFQQRRELIRLRGDNRDKTVAEKQDKDRIARLERWVNGIQATEVARRRRAAENRAAARSLAQSAATPNGPNVIRYSDIVRDHPEFAALRERETRRMILRIYGDALAGLNLSPDKLAKLKNLLVERQLSQQDAQEAAQAAGLERGSPGYVQAMMQARNDVQRQITDLLGPNGEAELLQAQAAAAYKSTVAMYATDFVDAGAALTATQTQGLAQAWASTMNFRTNPDMRTPGYNEPDPQTWLSPANQALLANAAQFLSPAQLDVLKSDLGDQNQRMAILRPYFRRGQAAGGPVIIAN